uniref:PKD_channel domain-containing protein n=1 Tax=Nippostrongylus brasiliensis TaxID=27835 RepID=A0A0N4XJZ5_NIPBR
LITIFWYIINNFWFTRKFSHKDFFDESHVHFVDRRKFLLDHNFLPLDYTGILDSFQTLVTLRIGQGGLFYLGSQNKFTNNLFVDVIAVVIYMFVALVLFATAHTLFQVTGGPYLFNYDALSYDIYRQSVISESIYSQFLSYWTTAANLAVYGPFEPFLHLLLSCSFLLLALVNNVSNFSVVFF